jgi:hypothetical protein
MKEKFNNDQLDLLNKKTYNMMIAIFEKEMNKAMIKKVKGIK